MTKPWYASKTIWINALITLAAIAGAVQELLTATQAVTLLAIINVILRAVSNQSVTWWK